MIQDVSADVWVRSGEGLGLGRCGWCWCLGRWWWKEGMGSISLYGGVGGEGVCWGWWGGEWVFVVMCQLVSCFEAQRVVGCSIRGGGDG